MLLLSIRMYIVFESICFFPGFINKIKFVKDRINFTNKLISYMRHFFVRDLWTEEYLN